MATRMPQLLGLFGDLWLTRWLNTPSVQAPLAEFTTLSQEADRMAVAVEKLPEQIAVERDTTLKVLIDHVSRERDQAIGQLVQGVTAEREAALDILLIEVRRIEARLQAEASESVDRLERQGRELLEDIFYHLIFLMLIGLVGYIVATLLIRLIFNNFVIFQNGEFFHRLSLLRRRHASESLPGRVFNHRVANSADRLINSTCRLSRVAAVRSRFPAFPKTLFSMKLSGVER
jgi:hypothetical protein